MPPLTAVAPGVTRVNRHVNAPRQRVYEALVDPQAVAAWMVPDGMTSHVHEFDAREGGHFRISLTYLGEARGKTDGRTDTYHGHFVRLVPDRQVVQMMSFETDDPAMKGEMTVRFTLADAAGGTDVMGEHLNVPTGIAPEDNETGWRMALDKLARLVESSSGTMQV